MRRIAYTGLCLAIVMATAIVSRAQDARQAIFAREATSKFVNLPGLPACMTIAVQRGDPMKGPSVLLLKLTPGCVVPWHWHHAGEPLMIVSGIGKAEMKGEKPTRVRPGDFLFVPSQHIHQFTALTALTMFDSPDAAFDIHYVDASGNEIPLDKALAKKPAK